VAWLVTRDGAEAEDAVQEAFIKAYGALGGFRSGASFKPWLLTIVGNEARNRRRSAARRAGLVLRARGEAEGVGAPEAAALADERRRAVLAALDDLAEADRLVISYRYLLEMSEAETAAALGVARGTVKSRLSRALARLRQNVDPSLLAGAP
jgi:RNA polymerase sigma factor (sigma-70 family)